VDGGTGSFGLCVDKCIEHLFEKKYIEGVRHGRVEVSDNQTLIKTYVV